MNHVLEKLYAFSGLVLILISVFNLMTEVGTLLMAYLFMCIGLFILFDSFNFFMVDRETLISSELSILNLGLFVVMAGAVTAFFFEVYGAHMTGLWPGFVDYESPQQFSTELIESVTLYGLLVLPGYSLFKILDEVVESETMLREEFGESDFYRFFVHLGVLMLAAPFALLFFNPGLEISYLLFLGSLIGLLLVVEYFEFRKKGQGIIANFACGDYDRFGAVMSVSIVLGVLATYVSVNAGFWVTEVPFEPYQLFGVPVSKFLIWTVASWTLLSGLNLFSEFEMPHFRPESLN